jgi:hypothetical protein
VGFDAFVFMKVKLHQGVLYSVSTKWSIDGLMPLLNDNGTGPKLTSSWNTFDAQSRALAMVAGLPLVWGCTS